MGSPDSGKESRSNSELSHEEEDDPCGDENAKASKGQVEVLSDGQVASDGKEGQGSPLVPDTLTGVFSTYEDTDP